ncbi:hypothetical protein TNCT_400711 [Trichonephila clavata]|uniref:Uncharacterized protein n=1 Tax=Trichonephila clavata TaxID=2740835 RepID=A0A8X6LTU5_TRICU|nr:hypothetical protein TNCT_400711 [Trichonephila clavata]
MANCINVSHADIAKPIEASDSEEVSEYENHISNEIERERSGNDFDTNNQQMNYKKSIQSKNREIKRKLYPLPHSSQSTAAKILKTTPGVTRYATERVTDVKSAFEVVFNSAIENEIIKMTNIEGENDIYGKSRKISKVKLYKHILDYYC